MKKTYMIPTMKVVKIQPANLLQTVSGRFGEGTKMGSEAAARQGRFSDWDEEDE